MAADLMTCSHGRPDHQVLIRQLAEALGLDLPAMPDSPALVWLDLLRRVRSLEGGAGDGKETCDNCHVHQPMHRGEVSLCCGCNVLLGGAPADWHPVCMATARGEHVPLNRAAHATEGAGDGG